MHSSECECVFLCYTTQAAATWLRRTYVRTNHHSTSTTNALLQFCFRKQTVLLLDHLLFAAIKKISPYNFQRFNLRIMLGC